MIESLATILKEIKLLFGDKIDNINDGDIRYMISFDMVGINRNCYFFIIFKIGNRYCISILTSENKKTELIVSYSNIIPRLKEYIKEHKMLTKNEQIIQNIIL